MILFKNFYHQTFLEKFELFWKKLLTSIFSYDKLVLEFSKKNSCDTRLTKTPTPSQFFLVATIAATIFLKIALDFGLHSDKISLALLPGRNLLKRGNQYGNHIIQKRNGRIWITYHPNRLDQTHR